MKAQLLILLSVFFVMSCISDKKITEVSYQNKLQIEEQSPKGDKYSMTIPGGYGLTTLVGGHDELEKQYVYRDSSKLYITNFGSSLLNYDNILSLGDSMASKRLESIELNAKLSGELNKPYVPDTILLQGRTMEGLYWKDIRIGYVSIGYVNIPESRKAQFDSALNSFIKKP